MSGTPPETDADYSTPFSRANWGPTRLSTALVLAVTVGVATLLSVSFGFDVPMLLAVGTAVVFAASLWLVDRDRWRVVTDGIVGLLTVAVGAGVVVAVSYATLGLVGALFPVASVGQVPAATLRLVSGASVVAGSVVAMLGGVTAVGNVLRLETVKQYFDVAVRALVVPVAVAGLMVGSALLANLEVTPSGTELGEIVAETVDGALRAWLAPGFEGTHLFTFVVLVLVTNLVLWRAVRALPVSEFATDRGADLLDTAEFRFRQLLLWGSLPVALLVPVSLLEFVLAPAALEAMAPPVVYGAVVFVTGSGLLRSLLFGLLLSGVSVILGVKGLRALAQSSPRALLQGLSPFVGGIGVVLLVAVVQEAVLAGTIQFIVTRIPDALAEIFLAHAEMTIEFYGGTAIVMAGAALLVGVTASLGFALWMLMALAYLPRRVAGPALASAGLFLASTFAGTVGGPPLLVLGGLIAALFVWDVGEYGVVLGRETGRLAPTRGVELVHATGTLAVGALGAGAVFSLRVAVTGGTVSELTTVPLALLGTIAGLFAVVLALG